MNVPNPGTGFELDHADVRSDQTVTTSVAVITALAIVVRFIGRAFMVWLCCDYALPSAAGYVFLQLHRSTNAGFTPDTGGGTDIVASAVMNTTGSTVRIQPGLHRRQSLADGLTSGVTYYYKVSAFCETGTFVLEASDGLVGNDSPVFLEATQR